MPLSAAVDGDGEDLAFSGPNLKSVGLITYDFITTRDL